MIEQRSRDTANQVRRYELLADVLREMIVSGELPIGSHLPAERDLVDITGLGRGSVREAVRILESEGLLSPKTPGRYGVSIVQNVSDKTVHRQLKLFIHGTSIANEDILTVRQIIEPALAQLAALNRTEEDIAAIQAVTNEMHATPPEERRKLGQLNLKWHSAVYRASHNNLLAAIAIGISETQHQARSLEVYGSSEHVEIMLHAHDRIFEAIKLQKPADAHRRMSKHMAGYSETLAQLNPREFPIPNTLHDEAE